MAGKIVSHTAGCSGGVEGFGSKKSPDGTTPAPPHIGLTTPPPARSPALNRFGEGLPGHPPQAETPMPTWP